MAKIALTVAHDSLATPIDLIVDETIRKFHELPVAGHVPKGIHLIYMYAAGDFDTLSWPRTNYWTPAQYEHRLRCALYDAREVGYFASDVDEAVLPDGTTVEF